MSLQQQVLAASRQAHSEQPERLATNRNVDCFRHSTRVLQILSEQGHGVAYVGKTRGEGQYTPPSGFPRPVGPWTITGISHDAVYVDDVQFDLIASGNDGSEPLGAPGVPIANQIDPQYYRANNPPVPYPISAVVDPPPPAPVMPTYEDLGGDEGAKQITRILEHDYKKAGRPGLDGDCGGWLRRTDYDVLTGIVPTVAASVTKHRDEWLIALGLIVSGEPGMMSDSLTCTICGASVGFERGKPKIVPHAADCVTR